MSVWFYDHRGVKKQNTMRTAILVTGILLFTTIVNAQWATPTFIKYYDAPFVNISGYSYSVAQAHDGGFAFVGESVYRPDSISYKSRMVLHKTNNAGVLLWQKVIDAPPGNMSGYSVRELDDSFLVICGVSEYHGLTIIKTTKNGDSIWRRNYSIYIGAPKLQLTYDNGFIVQGTKSAGGSEVQLVKFDADGNLIWQKHYDWFFYADLRGYDVAQTADSGFILTGKAFDPDSTGPCSFFIRTDKYGDTLWTRLFYSYPRQEISMRRVIPTSDGGYLAVGGNVIEGIALKLDGMGHEIWRKYMPAADGMDVYEDTGNAYYIFTFATSPAYKFSLQKLNISGDSVLWSHSYGIYTPQYAEAFSRTKEGGFIMTGKGRDSLGRTMAMLVKVDSVAMPVGMSDLEQSRNITEVFPNPANAAVIISSADLPGTALRIFDQTGRLVLEKGLTHTKELISVSTLPDGMYYYSISGTDRAVLKKGKLVISR